jgi:hypothetical protein
LSSIIYSGQADRCHVSTLSTCSARPDLVDHRRRRHPSGCIPVWRMEMRTSWSTLAKPQTGAICSSRVCGHWHKTNFAA